MISCVTIVASKTIGPRNITPSPSTHAHIA
jgi:hypothetical protein